METGPEVYGLYPDAEPTHPFSYTDWVQPGGGASPCESSTIHVAARTLPAVTVVLSPLLLTPNQTMSL